MSTESPIKVARAVAPGKVILLGEHAVVYGRPALAAAIDRHVEVRLRSCNEPIASHENWANADDAFILGSPPYHEGVSGAFEPQSASARVQRGVPSRALERAAALLGVPMTGLTAVSIADLPCAVGLGSSAALSVALVRALSSCRGRPLSDAAVCAYALEIEKIFHGH